MSRLPNKKEILAWVAENPDAGSKRDIAKAFNVKGDDRIELKRMLRELQSEGKLARKRRSYRGTEDLPPVGVLTIEGSDNQGDLWAVPVSWAGTGPAPRLRWVVRPTDPALGAGDRVLARLIPVDGEEYSHEARLVKRIENRPNRVLGIFRAGAEGGRILPVDKGAMFEWRVRSDSTLDAQDGELVAAEQVGPKDRMGLPRARIVEVLGDPSAARSVSLIAIEQHGLRTEFPASAIREAEGAVPAPVGNRTDLRKIPLVTIDPADARDHDDAVAAMPDEAPDNPDGMILWVAIADVAHYVTPGSALDREARERGNSTYFPDRVVPMLPEALSGDLCSLHEGVDRAVLALRIRLNAQGEKIDHRFHRAIMNSRASLSYEQAQAAADGQPDAATMALVDDVITPLWQVYELLHHAREVRQPLDLDLPERRIELSPDGRVTSVQFRDRFDAHRLIEECMVLANVCAAETLIAHKSPLLFRVHEQPTPEKLNALRDVAEASGLALAKGQVLQTAHLNRLLAQAEGTDEAELINMATLRSLPQAYYHPENLSHFGLSLRAYAHFTSPIRRYADLIVHRALISAHGWGEDGLSPEEIEQLPDTAVAISEAERRSMAAERDTIDRYLASFLAERIGDEMEGRISGVQKFGLFVKLDETGADGLVPIREVGAEYFHYDKAAQMLVGSETGLEIGIGQRVRVRLVEALPITGGIGLELLELNGDTVEKKPGGGGRGGRGGRPRRSGPTRTAARSNKRRKKRA